MAGCLGIYMENNLIKYAKVSKDHEKYKIDAFGIKMAEKIEDDIEQIVRETSSSRLPISINLSDEIYNYFDVFAMLGKKDIERTIKTEFEYFCEEKALNQKTLESRHFLIPSRDDKEKIRAVHVSTNRVEIAKKTQQFQGKLLRNISPLPLALPTLLDVDPTENFIIVNIEEKTSITMVTEGQVYKVYVLDDGMKDIFDKITARENSYSRAYQICKNTTIYTLNSQPQESEADEYLEDIMPTLYNIVKRVKEILDENVANIPRMYITGTGAVINNIDLYFQDNISKIKCQILKPYFIDESKSNVNIKDYIEVNSAIALALQGLGEGISGINFKELALMEKIPLPELPQFNFGALAGKKISLGLGFDKQLDYMEKSMLRLAGGILLAIVIYSGTSTVIGQQIEQKLKEAEIANSNMAKQISLAEIDISKIRNRNSEYTTMIQNLRDVSDETTEKYKMKNSIPILLNRIMSSIPKGVQLTAIKNTTDKHIVINAQSSDYQQIGYFKGVLRLDGILTDISSDSGIKQDGIVKVTIEGDLP